MYRLVKNEKAENSRNFVLLTVFENLTSKEVNQFLWHLT